MREGCLRSVVYLDEDAGAGATGCGGHSNRDSDVASS